jgi:hypothetical protein
MAGGAASVYSPYESGGTDAYVYLTKSDVGGMHYSDYDPKYPEPTTYSRNDNAWFEEFTGVYASHYGFAAAATEGGQSSAHAHGCIQAEVGLSP